jgi:hypothetical protein
MIWLIGMICLLEACAIILLFINRSVILNHLDNTHEEICRLQRKIK